MMRAWFSLLSRSLLLPTFPLLLFSYALARRTCPGKRRNVVGRGTHLGTEKKNTLQSLDGAARRGTDRTRRFDSTGRIAGI